ncbi:unnamed protein product [Haemonchus placei]|uniref:Transposase n=1 Tax=Haemonchus placei TaxID=6290 RepID=A0A0N4WGR3_HAEPC|nr:unnamed protein product [Haemonchus placei]
MRVAIVFACHKRGYQPGCRSIDPDKLFVVLGYPRKCDASTSRLTTLTTRDEPYRDVGRDGVSFPKPKEDADAV